MENTAIYNLADEEIRKNLPPGVKLVHTLRGHSEEICNITWSSNGRILASASSKKITLWDFNTGDSLHTLDKKKDGDKGDFLYASFDPKGHTLASGTSNGTIYLWKVISGRAPQNIDIYNTLLGDIYCMIFDPTSHILAIGSNNGTVVLLESVNGKRICTLSSFGNQVHGITFDSTGKILAASSGKVIRLWESINGRLLHQLEGHKENIHGVAFDPTGLILASGSDDKTVKIWDSVSGKLLHTLEGHTYPVKGVSFMRYYPILGSLSLDGKLVLWRTDTWESVLSINQLQWSRTATSSTGIAFHPKLNFLATIGSDYIDADKKKNDVIYIWELDPNIILGQPTESKVAYVSAKIVLVGDSGVGKTGLGWRLAHGEFKEHSSTHGQQFWLLKQLSKKRIDGAECEAVLWDLAGQPDYRLIHALFLDDVDLALVLFDPTRNDDSLSGVEYWLKQLKIEARSLNVTPVALIAARSDRGAPWIMEEELKTFCKQKKIKSYLLTSAKSGEGIEELVQQMKSIISWDNKPATVTTETFKRIKDFVLDLKEDTRYLKIILTPEELYLRLQTADRSWKFSDAEMLTAVGYLENHGYVKRLKTSQGELCILLVPEMLNNLAASVVLEARRNQRGLGSIEEKRLLSGEYKFPELKNLTKSEQDILLDSVTVLFLEHNICFRETDPLNGHTYLVFPELINMKKPVIGNDIPIEDGVAYTVSGAVENVYASLVVLMGYTQHFTRTNQWQNHARYEVYNDFVCGFQLEEERAGELDFVLNFGIDTPYQVRKLFQSLFEYFLIRRNLSLLRFEPVKCPRGHTLNRAVVRKKISSGHEHTFCNDCGEKIMLPNPFNHIPLNKKLAKEVEANHRAADQRTMFEQVLFRLKTYVTDQKITLPICFISYAWGNQKHESWVEHKLATDLQNAGITVVLDRWENTRIGSSIPRFVERIGKANRVIVVGTPLYLKKYENNELMRSFVVAAEGDLIGKLMIGTETEKESVLPVLLEGTKESSFPLFLQGRVYADFSDPKNYFDKALDLLLSLYRIQPNIPFVKELREVIGDKDEQP